MTRIVNGEVNHTNGVERKLSASFQSPAQKTGSPVCKAVIIAAGNGSRLNGYQNHLPKPLVKVGGLPLLERVILAARRIGVKEFVIVIGYQADRIRQAIDPQKLGVEITWVYNPEWEKQNGVSVLKAADYVEGNFFLFMSDHVFDPNIIQRVGCHSLGEDSGILCVDYGIKRILDLDDATKVCTENNRLINVGKGLDTYNAIDAGIFICSPELFDALRESRREGDESLSGGIRILARRGKMATFNIGKAFWQDVDTVSDMRHAEKLLLRWTRSDNDGVIARYINRPISNWVTKWLVKSPITPNQISVLNLLFSLFTAWLVSTGRPFYVVMAGVCFQLASILDGCDGEVAALKFKQSPHGALIDTISDYISYAAFIVGVTVGAFRSTNDPLLFVSMGGLLLLVLAALALGLGYVGSASGTLKDLVRAVSAFKHPNQKRWYLRLFGSIVHLGRRDVFSFATFLLLLSANVVFFFWAMIVTISMMCIGIIISVYSFPKSTPPGQAPTSLPGQASRDYPHVNGNGVLHTANCPAEK